MSSEVLPLLLETAECLGPAEGYPTLTAASFSHFYTPLLQASLSHCRLLPFSGCAAPIV